MALSTSERLWAETRRLIRIVIWIPLSIFIVTPLALLVGAVYAVFDILAKLTGVEMFKAPVKPLWRVWWKLWNWNHDNMAGLLVRSPNRKFSWLPWGSS